MDGNTKRIMRNITVNQIMKNNFDDLPEETKNQIKNALAKAYNDGFDLARDEVVTTCKNLIRKFEQ